MTKTRFLKKLILIILFFNFSVVRANTIQKCDSLIKVGVEAMQKKEHVKSLEILTKCKILAEKNKWYKQQFLAINNIGSNYFLLLEYGEALNYYLQSYTIAIKYLDAKHEMIVLNNIAIVYTKENKFEKATEYFLKAYAIAKERGDKLKTGMYALNLGNLENDKNNPNKARKYLEESITLLKDNKQFLIMAQICLANTDLLEGKFVESRLKGLKLLQNKFYDGNNDARISLLNIISKSYLKENNYEKSLLYANKIFKENPNLEDKIKGFELLAEIKFKLKDFQAAFHYKDSIIKLNEKLNEINNSKLFENSKVKFEIQNYKNEIVKNEIKIRNNKIIFLSTVFFLSITVIFIIIFFRKQVIAHKQKKLIAEKNEQIISLKLEKERSEVKLLEDIMQDKQAVYKIEQEQLKSEVEKRNRKLSAKALFLSEKNNILEKLLVDLTQISLVSKDQKLMKHVDSLRSHLKNDDEWNSFITHFEETNFGFLSSLKSVHLNLTANDIRFITYIYMNLSNKEIASLLNIAPESCRKRKERIAVKLGLSDKTKLYDYLTTFK